MTDISDSGPAVQAPHSDEAEIALLGALLLPTVGLLERLPEGFAAAAFYHPAHQRIFTAIQEVTASGQVADAVTVRRRIGDAALAEIGGPGYLMKLMEGAAPLSSQAQSYAELIGDAATRRAIIGAARAAIQLALKPSSMEAGDMVIAAQRGFDAVTTSAAPIKSLGEAAHAFVADLDKPASQALPTGFASVDRRLGGGLFRGDLIILAGRPSMGKTALVNAIARNLGRANYKVGMFSQEMSAEALAMRALSEASYYASNFSFDRVAYSSLRNGAPNIDRAKLKQYADQLQQLPILIDDRAGINLQQLEWSARAMRKQLGGLDAVVVDYLQILGRPESKGRSDASVIQQMTSTLKVMARTMGVAMVVLSQLSRQAENRDDKRPQLSDLRESGAIEQDADVVMGVFRESYYLERREPSAADGADKLAEWMKRMEQVRDVMEAITLKQRQGPVGTDILRTRIKHDVILDGALPKTAP